MADLSYDVQVNTGQAQRNLSSLQQSVGGINATFLRFRETIATISLGALINQSLQFADAISDLSDASNIAIKNIIGFSEAVQASGGTAEGAQKAILRLVNSIGEAADGSEETQKQFKAVGISLNDLRTLSEQEILQRTIQGLDKITDSGKRSIAVTALLGKEFRNVASGNLAEAYAQATAQAQRYSGATKSAADASDNIARAINVFRLEFLKQIQPLTDFINNINIARESISRFFDILGSAIKFAAIAFGLVAIGKVLLVIGSAAVTAYGAVTAITGGFIGLVRVLSNPVSRSALMENLGLLAGGLGTKVTSVLNAMGISTAFLAKHWLAVTAAVGGAVGALKEYLGISSKDPREGQRGRGDPQEIANREAEIAKAKELREVRDKAAEREMERYRKLQATLSSQQQTYNQLNTEADTFTNYLRSDLKFQTELLGMSEDQKEVAIALNNETQRYLQQQNQLQSKLGEVQNQIGIELRAQKTLKDDDLAASKDKVSALEDEESRLQELSKKYFNLHHANGRAIKEELAAQQRIKNAEQERISLLEYNKILIEQQSGSLLNLEEALRKLNDQRINVGFEADQQGMGPLARQMAQIQENARLAALEAGRAFAATFDSEDGLTPERAEQLAEGLAKIAEGYRNLADAQMANVEASRTWAAGWEEAFNSYAENAFNAADQAKSVFQTFTSGMEDAFVKFAQTGKLSFKDLANSIIADIIRIQVRRAAVSLFGGGGLFGGLFGGGRAAGGAVSGGTAYMVGESGPELFRPQSAGTIIPNNQLGMNKTEQILTTVNYNIQAVDAASFRSLVARDPQFLFQVTEKGRRSQPTRSRA